MVWGACVSSALGAVSSDKQQSRRSSLVPVLRRLGFASMSRGNVLFYISLLLSLADDDFIALKACVCIV